MIHFQPTVKVTVQDEAEIVSALATLKEMTGVDHLTDAMVMVLESSEANGSLYLVTGFSGEIYWTDDLEQAAEALEDEDEAVTIHWTKSIAMGEVEVK